MDLVDGEGNYKKLRAELRNSPLPAVPYLGMFLTELAYVDVRSSLYSLLDLI